MGKRLLRMNRKFLTDMFKAGEHSYKVIENAIPDDAVIMGVSEHLCFVSDEIAFRLESPQWDGPADGDMTLAIEPVLAYWSGPQPEEKMGENQVKFREFF